MAKFSDMEIIVLKISMKWYNWPVELDEDIGVVTVDLSEGEIRVFGPDCQGLVQFPSHLSMVKLLQVVVP